MELPEEIKNMDVEAFLKAYQILGNEFLCSMEKDIKPWNKRDIPIAHESLDKFFVWIRNNYRNG